MALTDRFPDEWVEQFRQGGEELDFVPWHRYAQRLNEEPFITWHSEVSHVENIGSQLLMVVDVTVTEGARTPTTSTHSGTGAADASKQSWGGAHAEAYSQAFRRACAHHGLGLYFYHDDESDVADRMTTQQKDTLATLADTGVFTDEQLSEYGDRIRRGGKTRDAAAAVIREMEGAISDDETVA